jgi:hypothetical protein
MHLYIVKHQGWIYVIGDMLLTSEFDDFKDHMSKHERIETGDDSVDFVWIMPTCYNERLCYYSTIDDIPTIRLIRLYTFYLMETKWMNKPVKIRDSLCHKVYKVLVKKKESTNRILTETWYDSISRYRLIQYQDKITVDVRQIFLQFRLNVKKQKEKNDKKSDELKNMLMKRTIPVVFRSWRRALTRYDTRFRNMMLDVIMRLKYLCNKSKFLARKVIIKLKGLVRKKYKMSFRTLYFLKKTKEIVDNRFSQHNALFDENGYYSDNHIENDHIMNFEMVYKAWRFGKLPSSIKLYVRNSGSKDPVNVIVDNGECYRIVLIKRNRSLSYKDYTLLEKWRDLIPVLITKENLKIRNAAQPIKNYASTLTYRILRWLRVVDQLHQNGSGVIDYMPKLMWRLFDGCVCIFRNVLYRKSESELTNLGESYR